MNLTDVWDSARQKCSKCKGCVVCNGKVCKGQIPGMGGKDSGVTFVDNVEAFSNYKIVMDVINECSDIDTSLEFMGHHVSLPVFAAPMAGIKNNYGCDMSDATYNKILAKSAKECGIMAFIGDGKEMDSLFLDSVKEVQEVTDDIIVTIKPWIKEGVDARLEAIEDYNYAFVAMDIDSCGLPLLRDSAIPVENKSVAKLKEVKEKANKPFIIKGIMSVEGALKAIEANADAIVVSNHGGRVLDEAMPTIEVLEDIAKVCKGKIKVLVDGGIRSGYDVFKCLALGADAVLIGRPLGFSVIGDCEEGLKLYLAKIENELRSAMLMSGCSKLSDINSTKVVKR